MMEFENNQDNDEFDAEFLKQVQKFGVLIPEEAIPEGIEFESFADVYDRCFRIMNGLPIK
jgi:hypothetical protein